MIKAMVYTQGKRAGVLTDLSPTKCKFDDDVDDKGQGISLPKPVSEKGFSFDGFLPFFEGLLPEEILLEGLLRITKIDQQDDFSQLMATSADLIGAVIIETMEY